MTGSTTIDSKKNKTGVQLYLTHNLLSPIISLLCSVSVQVLCNLNMQMIVCIQVHALLLYICACMHAYIMHVNSYLLGLAVWHWKCIYNLFWTVNCLKLNSNMNRIQIVMLFVLKVDVAEWILWETKAFSADS